MQGGRYRIKRKARTCADRVQDPSSSSIWLAFISCSAAGPPRVLGVNQSRKSLLRCSPRRFPLPIALFLRHEPSHGGGLGGRVPDLPSRHTFSVWSIRTSNCMYWSVHTTSTHPPPTTHPTVLCRADGDEGRGQRAEGRGNPDDRRPRLAEMFTNRQPRGLVRSTDAHGVPLLSPSPTLVSSG